MVPPTHQVKVPLPGYSASAVATAFDFSSPAVIFSVSR